MGPALFDNILHPDDVQTVALHHARMKMVKDGEVMECEYRMKHANGTWRVLRSQDIAFLRDQTGVVIQILGSATDNTEKKQSEVSLRESENRLRSTIENNNAGYFRIGPDGRFQQVNTAWLKMHKYTAFEEVLGQHFSIFQIDQDYESAQKIVESLFDGSPIPSGEFSRRCKDGSVGYHTFTANPVIEGSSIVAIEGFIIDITERKRAEDALRASEERLGLALNVSQMGTWELDIEHHTAWRSLRHDQIFGYASLLPEWTYEMFLDHVIPEDRSLVNQSFNEAVSDKHDWKFECRIKRIDGEIRWISAKGRNQYSHQGVPIRMLGLVWDITERKQEEETLRESEQRLNSAQRIAKIGDITWNVETGVVLWSDALYDLMQYDKSEKIDLRRVNAEIHHPDDLERVTTWLNDGIASGSDKITPNEYRIIRKDGKILYVHTVGVIHRGKGNQVTVFLTLQDITERKQTEEIMRASLAEKEILLREIHHRVKNNLTSIISLIELQIDILTDPAQINLLKDLKTRVRSMVLVHESLYVTHDLGRINFASYTDNLTRHLLQVYGTGNKIQCKIEIKDITMPLETAVPCGAVMSEIVTNSLKYAFPQSFSCEEIRKEPCTIDLSLHFDGSDYLLKIADNGVGIPEGVDSTMSHSLGLFLIRFIVEHQLQGSLEISTAQGTAYTIRFPVPVVKE